jgi:hydroxymethylbilane synthase
MLPRADVRDRLIGADRSRAAGRARGRHSSPRRAAQLLRAPARPQDRADPRQCRNPAAKVEAGEVDATLLAAAGLDRLVDRAGPALWGLFEP